MGTPTVTLRWGGVAFNRLLKMAHIMAPGRASSA